MGQAQVIESQQQQLAVLISALRRMKAEWPREDWNDVCTRVERELVRIEAPKTAANFIAEVVMLYPQNDPLWQAVSGALRRLQGEQQDRETMRDKAVLALATLQRRQLDFRDLDPDGYGETRYNTSVLRPARTGEEP